MPLYKTDCEQLCGPGRSQYKIRETTGHGGRKAVDRDALEEFYRIVYCRAINRSGCAATLVQPTVTLKQSPAVVP